MTFWPHRAMAGTLCILTTTAVASCTRQDLNVPTRPISPSAQGAHAFRSIPPAVIDTTMGTLSPIAQSIALALQDSSVRMAVNHAMKGPSAGPSGLDLQDCSVDPAVIALLASAERRGGTPARINCARLSAMAGAILYMNASELRGWDGTAIPVVTAIEHGSGHLPATLRAYRSPDRVMEFPVDGSFQGPVLVVLPIAHSKRLRSGVLAPPPLTITTHADPPSSPTKP